MLFLKRPARLLTGAGVPYLYSLLIYIPSPAPWGSQRVPLWPPPSFCVTPIAFGALRRGAGPSAEHLGHLGCNLGGSWGHLDSRMVDLAGIVRVMARILRFLWFLWAPRPLSWSQDCLKDYQSWSLDGPRMPNLELRWLTHHCSSKFPALGGIAWVLHSSKTP